MAHIWQESELKALGAYARAYLQNADEQPDRSVTPPLPGRYVSNDELRSHLLDVIMNNGEFKDLKLNSSDLPDRYTFGQMMGRYGQGCHPRNDKNLWILRSGNMYEWVNSKGKKGAKQAKNGKPRLGNNAPGDFVDVDDPDKVTILKHGLTTTAESTPKKKIKKVRIYWKMIFILLIPAVPWALNIIRNP